ncbi:MAG: 30S ribosomal protein S9 [Nanoarchaeota archaeon]
MTKGVHVSGSRKKAIARATLIDGKGIVRINGQLLDHFCNEHARMRIHEPLMLAGDFSKKVNISVRVHGGGWSAQTDAVRMAIARSLAESNPSLKSSFLDYDRHLLVQDSRANERSKPNDSKPRAKRTKSYR